MFFKGFVSFPCVTGLGAVRSCYFNLGNLMYNLVLIGPTSKVSQAALLLLWKEPHYGPG